MITIVSGTNRPDNYSVRIAKIYAQLLENEGAEFQLLDLRSIPKDIAFSETYGQRSNAYEQDFVKPIENSDKFVFVIPEYNGGFPGILKLFIDSIAPALLHKKKAGLIGISNGRAGAARAMDQFSNVLNYLQVDVIHEKPKLSGIQNALDENDNLINEDYTARLIKHAKHMISF